MKDITHLGKEVLVTFCQSELLTEGQAQIGGSATQNLSQEMQQKKRVMTRKQDERETPKLELCH